MLISTIAQMRTASSINISNTIEAWTPYLSDAEEMFIIPTIGREIYEILDTTVHPKGPIMEVEGEGDAITVELLARLTRAIALYALYLGIDEMAVSISSAGIQVIQSDSHKPAPQFQIMNVKETFLSRAHRQIDSFLDYFNANATHYPSIATPLYPYFIRNAAEFQQYADIHSSRRVFLSLLPIIGSIETKYIKPTLSPALFDYLKLNFNTPESVSADDKALLDLILPALAHLTIARALLEVSIDMLDWGVFNNAANTFNSIQTKSQANQMRISAMHEANQKDGEAELKMLQELLDNSASADKYALYFTSSRYGGKENAVKRGEFVNDTALGIFVV
jgi:hypothetical protein